MPHRGLGYHKNTNAKVDRANGVISDTLRAYANGRKDDWDSRLPLAVFAVNNTHGGAAPWPLGMRERVGCTAERASCTSEGVSCT